MDHCRSEKNYQCSRLNPRRRRRRSHHSDNEQNYQRNKPVTSVANISNPCRPDFWLRPNDTSMSRETSITMAGIHSRGSNRSEYEPGSVTINFQW